MGHLILWDCIRNTNFSFIQQQNVTRSWQCDDDKVINYDIFNTFSAENSMVDDESFDMVNTWDHYDVYFRKSVDLMGNIVQGLAYWFWALSDDKNIINIGNPIV